MIRTRCRCAESHVGNAPIFVVIDKWRAVFDECSAAFTSMGCVNTIDRIRGKSGFGS